MRSDLRHRNNHDARPKTNFVIPCDRKAKITKPYGANHCLVVPAQRRCLQEATYMSRLSDTCYALSISSWRGVGMPNDPNSFAIPALEVSSSPYFFC
jgi:hypothetical protein